jgi:hypothetical protein
MSGKKSGFAGTVKRLNEEYEKRAAEAVGSATSRDAAVSREVRTRCCLHFHNLLLFLLLFFNDKIICILLYLF